MAAVAAYLADTSALARLSHPQVSAVLAPLIDSGLVATCAMVDFEVLWSTRSVEEYDAVRHDRSVGYECLTIEDVDFDRFHAITDQPTRWVVPAGSI